MWSLIINLMLTWLVEIQVSVNTATAQASDIGCEKEKLEIITLYSPNAWHISAVLRKVSG